MKDNSTLAKNLISISPEELKVDMNVKKILGYKPSRLSARHRKNTQTGKG